MSQINNKIIWITGASSGIGEALVKEASAQNAKVVLSSRREAELIRVKKIAGLSDERSLILPLDLAEHGQMEDKVEKVIEKFGRIDILINNGGISQRSLIVDTEFSVYKRLMDIDYLGTVALSTAVLPHFINQRSGHYAVVTSLMGKFSSPLRSGYCGAKHALHGFFDALRLEHDDDGIKVTMICPGFIKTDISINSLTGDGSEQKTMDKTTGNGMSAETCAKKIMQAIAKNKMEVGIGGKETYALWVKRFFPGLLHRIVKKSNVT